MAFILLLSGVSPFSPVFQMDFRDFRVQALHELILWLYLGALIGFSGLACGFVSRRSGVSNARFAAPLCGFHWSISGQTFLFFDFHGTAAHSQYHHPLIIQIASITGVYGVSLLIVMVNSAIAAISYPFIMRREKTRQLFSRIPLKRGKLALVVTATSRTALALFYGHIVISRPIVGERVKVSVLQGNVSQTTKWDQKYKKFRMQTYADLTRESSKNGPALIIWPESATPNSTH